MIRDMAAKRRIIILITGCAIVAMAFFFISGLSRRGSHRIHPVDGLLDLRSWNPRRDGPLILSGQWDFYWRRFLSYRDFKTGHPLPDIKAAVPGVWNGYKLRGKSLPGFGYATYRLHVNHAPRGIPLALRIQTFSTAYRLYINDHFLAARGKVGPRREKFFPEYRPKVVEFTADESSFDVIVHVANFSYARGGMWFAVNFGTREQIRDIDRTIVDKDLFLFGALVIMVFYYLSIYLLRREDKSSLYLVLMCVLLASRTVVYGDYLIYRLFPFVSFQAIITIEYITVCWFPVISGLMIGELFPEENSRKVLKLALVYAAGMTALIVLTPIYFYSGLVHIIQVVAIAIGLYSIGCVSAAFIEGKKDSTLILIGTLVLCATAVHDILYQNNLILSNYGELVPFGLFIMLFTGSFILARRFSEAFQNVNELSQKLLKLDKIKDEFLANTSHELRTPLSGILGITEAMLRGSEGELSGSQKDNLAVIAGSCRRLANLVNDILDYSKLKHGDVRLNLQPVRLDGLIQSVVKVFQQLNKTKEYKVISDVPAGLPAVLADENRVAQILYNLIGNAVKFTTRGHVKVSAKVTGEKLEVCVRDTGEGIPEDKLEDVFKSFEQVDTSLTRRHGGTGLGLSITKQLVELQGGRIWVQSVPGSGSAFYFTLPITAVIPPKSAAEFIMPELEAAAFEEKPVIIHEEGKGAQVLLVDDDAVNLQAAAAILKIGGYAITAVNSGRAALDEVAKHKNYSLVVLDVMMPEMSGYEVCRRIRENQTHFDLPVLMVTAKTTIPDLIMGFEAGVNDYLPKPFEPEEFLARVRTLVNLKTSVDKAIAAEVAFMQAQIKPHFLYNTLNTISSFCDTAPERARQLIDEFSNYLRQSFDFQNLEMFVPLEKEISLVKSYVEIEKARFGAKLKAELEMDQDIHVKILSLSIQPLVENAIRHGIRKKGGSGTVIIGVKKTNAGVLVSVTDNGAGIHPEKLAQILSPNSNHEVGLWNIDARLRKFFGKGLTIESELGKGTRVSFVIPPEVA